MTSRNRKNRSPAKAPGAGASIFDLTKIDVAAAQIRTAVKLFFEASHPVPIYVLASSAREILTTIGGKLGVKTTVHELADAKAASFKDVIKRAHKFASFFKHADKDPDARLHFYETEVDPILFMACRDFVRVSGKDFTETRVFQLWMEAIMRKRVSDAPLRQQQRIKYAINKLFPGIRSADRKTQKRIGLELLNRWTSDPDYHVEWEKLASLSKP